MKQAQLQSRHSDERRCNAGTSMKANEWGVNAIAKQVHNQHEMQMRSRWNCGEGAQLENAAGKDLEGSRA